MPDGKDFVLEYLKENVGNWVHNRTLRDASGLNDVPRTVRMLRQEGWQIEVDGRGNVRLSSLQKGAARGLRKAVSARLRFEVLGRDGFRCYVCGRSASDGVKLEVDHILPVDWGGETTLDNLQTLCDECNRGKKAWTDASPPDIMRVITAKPTVAARIEALFDNFPNQDIPSSIVRLVSKGAFDWQRALRKVRQDTGKRILPTRTRTAYRYYKEH